MLLFPAHDLVRKPVPTFRDHVLFPRQPKQRSQTDTNQAAGKCREKPDPAMQRARSNTADKGADVAAKPETCAPTHQQAPDARGQH